MRVEHWVEEGRRLVLDLDDIAEVHVRIIGGDVAVGATSGPTRLETECLAGEPIRVDLTDGVLIIEHRQDEPKTWLSFARPRFEALVDLTVPPDVPVDVKTVTAPVVTAGLAGDVDLKTVTGEVTCRYLTGSVSITTVSAQIDVDAVSGRFNASSVSGDINVLAGCVSDFAAKTVSGEVTVDLDIKLDGTYHISTVSGDVAARVPDDSSLVLDATTLSGALAAPAGLDDTSGSRRKLKGRMGAGEATMRVHTLSGDFVLLSRAAAEPQPLELAR
jgi:hypothetical protein